MIQKRTLENLEFNKILDMLRNNCVTYVGKQLVDELYPSSDMYSVKKMLSETSEACSLALRKNDPPIAPICNLDSIIAKINIGSILTIEELLKIATTLKIFRDVKQYFQDDYLEDIAIINEYFEQLYTNKNLEQEIFRCIKNDTELDDHASPELYRIRKQINDSASKIKDKLNNIIHSSSTSKFLQDSVVTFRNGRYVIPVKQEYRNEIDGLVHDSSASGSTIFIEPTSVFNINNEIKELYIKEQAEIERILALLTQMVSPLTNELKESTINLGKIDFAFSKAKLSFDLNAFEPLLNDHGYINLKKARHPLIDAKKIVPIDVWLGDKFNSLVITGPNTGGKTVTLKTVGLLTLMAQSGLHIPAMESSEVAVFDNIYSDIGDEQSIEQSLSTFSSHMTNLVNITNNITNKDLVLVDELDSGTDPIEGSALARAILTYFHDIDCRTIATTHYSELKTFAMQTPGIENASCEFDFEKLAPTYHLLIGIPGRSNAFLISQKLGLSQKILDDAGSYINEENVKFEDILSNIEHDKKKAKEQRELTDKMLSEAKSIKESATKMQTDIESRKTEILNKAKTEARDILIDAEEEANKIIKELIEIKETSSKDQYKKAEENRQKIKASISSLQKDLLVPKVSDVINALKEKDIKKGMLVYVPALEQDASVITLPDKYGNLIVQAGILKLNTHISNIEKSKTNDVKIKPKTQGTRKTNTSLNAISEINLLGKTVDEATSALDKFLDDAYLAGLHEVRVVHGKGTGALRAGVQQYLKTHPLVKSYRIGMYGEGDSGVTIVEL